MNQMFWFYRIDSQEATLSLAGRLSWDILRFYTCGVFVASVGRDQGCWKVHGCSPQERLYQAHYVFSAEAERLVFVSAAVHEDLKDTYLLCNAQSCVCCDI